MEIIRQQAELAAAGKPFGVREKPQPIEIAKPAAKAPAGAAPTADGEMDPEKAARLAKREAALARKRAKETAGG
jgi:hypothetical protein